MLRSDFEYLDNLLNDLGLSRALESQEEKVSKIIAKFVPDSRPEARKLLEVLMSYQEAMNEIIKVADQRSVFMAERIAEHQGKIAVLVGRGI